MAAPEDVLEDEINRIVQELVDKTFQKSQEKLVEENKIDTGAMFKTANVVRGNGWAEIVYLAKHSSWVHNGRTVGSMPPVESLIPWVRRKLGVPEAQARNVAFKIAKSIEQRGIQAFPFLEDSYNEALAESGLL